MGIDVSLRRGLDVVALDARARLWLGPVKAEVGDLERLVALARPSVIAIDAPPAWAAAGRSRAAERRLLSLGLAIFATPQDPGSHPFYAWMRAGFEVFAAVARLGYPLHRGGSARFPCAIEVFPHATAVVLRGSLPARGVPKRVWRRRVLEGAGVEHAPLRTLDELDAALAALTGLHLLRGTACQAGEEGEAVLVLPGRRLPSRRFEREGPP
ncbi:MAG: DUF429 domain-containing protein [Candidatus Dormibacterales bacterium]